MEYKGKKIFEEAPEAADSYRRAYSQGIGDFIASENRRHRELRAAFVTPEALAAEPEKYRSVYRRMLGLDAFPSQQEGKPICEYVGEDEISRIYRLVVYPQALIPFYSLLLIPHGAQRPMPLVIAQHGGGGTPELCSDMCGKNNYSHMVQRLLERGAAVLAPQLLLWAREELETARAHPIAYDRGKTDRELKRFGTSVTALEIVGIQRSLDYVLTMDEIEQEQVGMIGLSYGGYFTLHTMAAEPRIKAGYSAGAFNDRDAVAMADWHYQGSAGLFQDAETAGLCAPRKLYVQVGKADPVFDYRYAVPEAERAAEYFKAFGCPENFVFDLWEGGHRVSDDDAGFDFLFSALTEQEAQICTEM